MPGKLTLPEISVAWWDVKEDKLKHAIVPERTISVSPSTSFPSQPKQPLQQPQKIEPQTPPLAPSLPHPSNDLAKDLWIYGVVGVLFLTLIGLLVWAFKIPCRKKKPEVVRKDPLLKKDMSPQKESSMKDKNLTYITTPKELYRFLQEYGELYWGSPKNASLEVIFSKALEQSSDISQEDIEYVVYNLHDALYGEKEINFSKVKNQCERILLVTKCVHTGFTLLKN